MTGNHILTILALAAIVGMLVSFLAGMAWQAQRR